MKKIKLNQIATCDLVDELAKRAGVAQYFVEPHEGSYKVHIDNEAMEGNLPIRIDETGPARILIVTD